MNLWILAFSINFCPFKIDLSGNAVWPQASGFQKLARLTIFGSFEKLLYTQNVNVARFAHNVQWDFFFDFQTPWNYAKTKPKNKWPLSTSEVTEVLKIGADPSNKKISNFGLRQPQTASEVTEIN